SAGLAVYAVRRRSLSGDGNEVRDEIEWHCEVERRRCAQQLAIPPLAGGRRGRCAETLVFDHKRRSMPPEAHVRSPFPLSSETTSSSAFRSPEISDGVQQ